MTEDVNPVEPTTTTSAYDTEPTWQQELNNKRLASGGWYGCISPDGWKDIVLSTDAMLSYIDPNYKINQIKEKFGTLRYYFDTEKDGIEREIMWAIASDAERRSASVCEICGKYGELNSKYYYIRTLCQSCALERDEEVAKKWEDAKEQK